MKKMCLSRNAVCRTLIYRFFVLLLLLIVCLCPLSPERAFAANQSITRTGDILQLVLPGLAVGSTFFAGNDAGGWWDREGSKEVALSITTTSAIVLTGKEAAHKFRPDESDRNSFPSGHTSASFSGASFIWRRYGWQWGLPAAAAASFVGYSRFQANQHYADDILAGASIAVLSNLIWVDRKHDGVSFLPVALDGGAGFRIALTTGGAQDSEMTTPKLDVTDHRYRFNFSFGPAYVAANKVSGGDGTFFDMYDIEEHNNPLTTAIVHVDAVVGDRHELGLSVWPMESREKGSLPAPITFMGVTFPGNTPLESDWRLFDVRLRWRYDLAPSSPFIVKAGAGAMVQYHVIKLEAKAPARKAEEDDLTMLPFVHATIGYRLTEGFSFYVDGDGGWLPESRMMEAGAYLQYTFHPSWNATMGYQYRARDIDQGDVRNKVVQHLPYLAVGYSW